MQQLDLFLKNSESYLYHEIEKVRNSMDKRSRAMFSLISELQEQLLSLREEQNKHSKENE